MKKMKVKLKVVHFISGRARIKIDSGFDPRVFFVVVEAGLREIKEIKKADVNPYSQSITIHFKEDIDVDIILDDLKRILMGITNDPEFSQRLEDIKDALTYADKGSMDVFVRDKILMVTRNLDHAVKRITGNTVDMKTAVPVSSFATGVATLILAPGWATPAWLVLLTFGITSFNLLKNDYRNTTALVNRSYPEGNSAENLTNS
ncbi:MAG: hypothetical protein H8E10_18525 [Desulfobacterales bacterium]|nr:hypothetical protein [Desulfobacterales bacterium]MBL7205127.1 hypothetical protein [Desulfobacteraceae bacterium]